MWCSDVEVVQCNVVVVVWCGVVWFGVMWCNLV